VQLLAEARPDGERPRGGPALRGTQRPGFTIVELLVVVSIIAVLLGILLPGIGKALDSARTTRSATNMRNLGLAHAAYSADWGDRQWTMVPDDAGLYTVQHNMTNWYQAYMAAFGANAGGCPPQLVLGWNSDPNPLPFGYWLPCFSSTGLPGNFQVYQPCNFTPGNVYGSFRLINAESFNNYVNGRFYDPVFYAPKDFITLEGAEKYFALPDEYTQLAPDGTGGIPSMWHSTYVCSPAAMWAPDVFSLNKATQKYFTAPWKLPGGYRSPPAGAATYTDLKTRMIEHHWLQNKPNSDINYNFSGGYTPWYFNHGYGSAPITLFYDGHIRPVGCGDAIDADCRSEKGLWSRDTPLGGSPKCTLFNGQNGYYTSQAYDYVTSTSHTILTIDGIKGRDVLGVK
jgi:prepilin-type N-terminal cleavage/methylation domain-containing protein